MRFPPANTVLVHLIDGAYSLDLSPAALARAPTLHPASSRLRVEPAPTASYNTLMKLCTLERARIDVVASRDAVAARVDALLQPPPELPQVRDDPHRAHASLSAQRHALAAVQRRRDALVESLRARRDAIRAGREAAAQAAAQLAIERSDLEAVKRAAAATRADIEAQRRRVCNDLAAVYPIAPDPANASTPLAFAVCGLALPNTTYDAAAARAVNEDVVSAALGLVARLVDQLQCYLGIPIPYPVAPFGSRSAIRDDISLIPESLFAASRGGPASSSSSSPLLRAPTPPAHHRPPPSSSSAPPRRDYPLFLPRGGSTAGQFRFDYAWFLLNKDIEALAAARGLRVVDIRHTLPNLKSLLYACGAGSDADALPERKRGGIRALLLAHRPGSAGSEAVSERAGAAGAGGAGLGVGAVTAARDLDGATLANASPSPSPTSVSVSVSAPPSLQGAASPMATTTTMTTTGPYKMAATAAFGVGGNQVEAGEDGAPVKMSLRTRGLRESVAASP
jgi:hypothetical protein